MNLWKPSERKLTTRECIKTFKVLGATFTTLGEYMKWKELLDGSRLSVSLTLYRMNFNGMDVYFFSDSLGRVANAYNPSREEMMSFLSDHGFKTDHDFYIEDYGMSEETYAEWNS